LTSLIPHADAPPPPSSSDDPSTISNGSGSSSRDIVSTSLVALCDAATDDALLKQLNLAVLMHTRADDAHVRIFALRCARALWSAHGRKLIGKRKFYFIYLTIDDHE
jgi:U3 small nucleolar RNA-associated protein 10